MTAAAVSKTRARLSLSVIVLLTSVTAAAQTPQDPKALLTAVAQHEADANEHRGHYLYTSEERSDRTGGHLWVERVAETQWGKLRYLTAEDGQPLPADRLAAERAHLATDAADPEAFRRAEAARSDDEQHARAMLQLLPKAFLFDAPVADGASLRLAFRPDPGYSPQSLEERILHGMSGTVRVDREAVRLRGIEGEMAHDLSIGMGLIATIHAGSSFSTTREPLEGVDWKTQTVHADIRGKALFLKTIARKQDSTHRDFHKISDTITLPEAVTLLEQEPAMR